MLSAYVYLYRNYLAAATECQFCEGPTIADSSHTQCVICPLHAAPTRSHDKCVNCPTNQLRDIQGSCQQTIESCPSEQIRVVELDPTLPPTYVVPQWNVPLAVRALPAGVGPNFTTNVPFGTMLPPGLTNVTFTLEADPANLTEAFWPRCFVRLTVLTGLHVTAGTIGIAEAAGLHRDVAAAGTQLYGNSAVLPKLQPSFLRQEHFVLVLSAPTNLNFLVNLQTVPSTTMSIVASVVWCNPAVTTFDPSVFTVVAEPDTLSFAFEDETAFTFRQGVASGVLLRDETITAKLRVMNDNDNFCVWLDVQTPNMTALDLNELGEFHEMRINLGTSFTGTLPSDSVQLVPLPASMVYFDINCTSRAGVRTGRLCPLWEETLEMSKGFQRAF